MPRTPGADEQRTKASSQITSTPLSVVDKAFVKALPKAELHAHLSGSISAQTLHELWERRVTKGECLKLQDPLDVMPSSREDVNIVSFFPIFDGYIYQLLNDVESIQYATESVIADFARDGVAYLELRTTPRESLSTSRAAYVEAVHQVVGRHNLFTGGESDQDRGIEVRLILSIDRSMAPEQAEEVVDLALKHKGDYVVGVDLCGNPIKGDVTSFTPAILRAKAQGLHLTVHFAEVPGTATELELSTILSWQPDRLGHTDDVGIFGSPLSNEYLLAAMNFDLGAQDLVGLSRSAASITFADCRVLKTKLDRFEDTLRLADVPDQH
ncbi:hypothetical protein LTR62_006813 [Meristemomyces frigidus]|uniref:Adenosine deaminase domain-containing protein n=1 Tax=Meristemomyces frigidus TaxID=1508187 RepID=A0AAN7YID3_9PEZI|nr:hypothetical protein LTR62_006813 [Meristemomyces frigidus]